MTLRLCASALIFDGCDDLASLALSGCESGTRLLRIRQGIDPGQGEMKAIIAWFFCGSVQPSKPGSCHRFGRV